MVLWLLGKGKLLKVCIVRNKKGTYALRVLTGFENLTLIVFNLFDWNIVAWGSGFNHGIKPYLVESMGLYSVSWFWNAVSTKAIAFRGTAIAYQGGIILSSPFPMCVSNQ